MKILAIDSSGLVATVALLEDDCLRAEYTINYKKTHSQTLLPMIDEIVKMTETDLTTVDAIAVAGGPGSFTGLRIGSATAKGLGFALEKPIVNVPTIKGMAYNYYGNTNLICPIMDARRNQVYTGLYYFDQDEKIVEVMEQCALGVDELLARLQELKSKYPDKKIIFLGDGVPVQKAYIEEHAEFAHTYASANNNGQKAGSLAVCAAEMYVRGEIENADEHHPDYLRLSQAERERAEKIKENEKEQ